MLRIAAIAALIAILLALPLSLTASQSNIMEDCTEYDVAIRIDEHRNMHKARISQPPSQGEESYHITASCEFRGRAGTDIRDTWHNLKFNGDIIPSGHFDHPNASVINVTRDLHGCQSEYSCSGNCTRFNAYITPPSVPFSFTITCTIQQTDGVLKSLSHTVILKPDSDSSTPTPTPTPITSTAPPTISLTPSGITTAAPTQPDSITAAREIERRGTIIVGLTVAAGLCFVFVVFLGLVSICLIIRLQKKNKDQHSTG